MRELTHEEKVVLYLLADSWNAFCKLPILHPACAEEMAHAIHAAQNIVFSRPAFERLREIDNE